MIKEFDGKIETLTKEPCIVDIWAEWCGPCKVMGKNLEEFAQAHPEITIYKIDAEQYPDIAEHFNIMSLPTIIYMDKRIIWRYLGLMTIKQLEDKLWQK